MDTGTLAHEILAGGGWLVRLFFENGVHRLMQNLLMMFTRISCHLHHTSGSCCREWMKFLQRPIYMDCVINCDPPWQSFWLTVCIDWSCRPMRNEHEWAGQGPTYENFRCYRSKIPIWHGQGGIGRIESSSGLPQRPSRDREPIADGRSPSPPEAHTAYYRNCFPDTLLNRVWAVEENQMVSNYWFRFLKAWSKRSLQALQAHISLTVLILSLQFTLRMWQCSTSYCWHQSFN